MKNKESKKQRVMQELLPKLKGTFYIFLFFYLILSLEQFWRPGQGEGYINIVNLAILVVILGLVVFGMEKRVDKNK